MESVKVKSNLQHDLPRIVRGIRPPKKGRRLNSVEIAQIYAVEKIGGLGGDLDSNELLVAAWSAETECLARTQINARKIRPAPRVAPHTYWAVVDC